jgi:hypothetical protein
MPLCLISLLLACIQYHKNVIYYVGHDRFLSHSFRSIINNDMFIRRYIFRVTDSIVKHTTKHNKEIRCRSRVVAIPASHSECCRFKSRPEDGLRLDRRVLSSGIYAV